MANIYFLHFCAHGLLSYRKSSIKPPGAYLILDIPEGGLLERGLIRKGGLFKKLDEKDIYVSFISLLPHILLNIQF